MNTNPGLERLRQEYQGLLEDIRIRGLSESLTEEEEQNLQLLERMFTRADQVQNEKSRQPSLFLAELYAIYRRLYFGFRTLFSFPKKIRLSGQEERLLASMVAEVLSNGFEATGFSVISDLETNAALQSASFHKRLLLPDIQQAVRILSRRVISLVKPVEMPVFEDYIDYFIGLTAQGKFHPYTVSATAGSLGSGDLLLKVVVPVVSALMDKMMQEVGAEQTSQLVQILHSDEDLRDLLAFSEDQIETCIRMVQSKPEELNVKEITDALRVAFQEFISDAEDEPQA